MKKLLIIITSLIFLSPVTNAQLWKLRRYEFSAEIGTTQFYSDIGGYSPDKNILGLKDFTFNHTRFNINTSLRYRISEVFSARVNRYLVSFTPQMREDQISTVVLNRVRFLLNLH